MKLQCPSLNCETTMILLQQKNVFLINYWLRNQKVLKNIKKENADQKTRYRKKTTVKIMCCGRPWAQTLQPVLQHPDQAPFLCTLTCLGSQNPRIPGVWSHQDLRVPEAA